MGDVLLSYDVSSNPDPLQASPQTGDPSLAMLMIVVSNDTHQPIDCQSISFGFLQGTDAKDLFPDSTGIGTSAPTGWSLKQEGSLFTATPDTSQDGAIGADSLTFVLTNIKVNGQPGRTDMTVTEVTSSNTGTLDYPLAKFPPQFEVGDLQVSPPPPVTPGSSVTLIWSGSDDGATYELQYEDADGNTVTITHPKGEPDQPLPSTGSYTISSLEVDTTFYLIVTLPVPGQDEPLTVERFFPVTVEKLQPQVTLFEGKVEWSSSSWQLVLNWQTENADYCTITDDAHQLNPSSMDDSYKIPLTPYTSDSFSYTLTAKNSVGQDTSQITVAGQFQLINSVQVGGETSGVAVSPDGTRIYIANFYMAGYTGGNLRVFDAGTLQAVGNPIAVGTETAGVALSPDGTLLYVVSSFDGNLWVLNTSTLQFNGNPIPLGGARDGVSAIAASPDGRRLYILNTNDFTILMFDAESLQHLNTASVPGGLYGSVGVSPDSQRVYVIKDPDSVVCYDAETLQPTGPTGWTAPEGSASLAVSADGERIYFASYPASALWALDARTLQPIGNSVALPAQPGAVCVSPLNPLVYVASDSGTLYIYSIINVSGGKTPATVHDVWAAPHLSASCGGEEEEGAIPVYQETSAPVYQETGATSGPLLTYAVQSSPDPIQASPQSGDPSLATLTIVVSNDTHTMVDCQSISFGFLEGTDAKDFFSDATGIGTSAPTGWSLTASGSLFTAKPDPSPAHVGQDGLVFVLSNIQVNEQPGTTDMTITEVTGSGVGVTGTESLQLSKFPLQFEVGELTADPPSVAQGDSTTLSWSGTSGATYELQYQDQNDNTVTVTHPKGEPDQPLPSTGNYTIDDLQQDTTFYLIVTLTVQGEDQPVTAIRFFPVIVSQPAPVIEYFRPQGCTDETCIIYASEFVLEWQIEYASEMQLTGTDSTGTHVINVAWGDTSTQITQTENETEYTMTIKNEAGDQQQATVAVTLIPPVLVGTVVAFAGPADNLSAGWLNCNGQEVSGTMYPQLLALLGNTYGVPQTSGNVVLPNFTGLFLRGIDSMGVIDPDCQSRTSPIPGDAAVAGPVIGSRQGQQLLNHTHTWDQNFAYITHSGDNIQVQLCSNYGGNAGNLPTTNNDGGGNETRPVNVYVYYLIYGGVPQNQGQSEPPK